LELYIICNGRKRRKGKWCKGERNERETKRADGRERVRGEEREGEREREGEEGRRRREPRGCIDPEAPCVNHRA